MDFILLIMLYLLVRRVVCIFFFEFVGFRSIILGVWGVLDLGWLYR